MVIIGGGFTAVDCARAARRLLGEEHRVTAIMYRRGEEHMSASPDEIWQLRLEGIDVGTLVNPARVRMRERPGQGGDLRPQRAGRRAGRRRQTAHPPRARQRVSKCPATR